jgi:hypothetical protein
MKQVQIKGVSGVRTPVEPHSNPAVEKESGDTKEAQSQDAEEPGRKRIEI